MIQFFNTFYQKYKFQQHHKHIPLPYFSAFTNWRFDVLVTYADSSNIQKLASLFDQYRIFYGQTTDIAGAIDFLNSRLKNNDSVIIVAHESSELTGFTQLYPSFSSVGMEQIWVLNDLFVNPTFRRQNVAKKLIEAARKHAEKTGALRIDLATQVSNTFAQNLYESMGYTKNEDFYHYSRLIKIDNSSHVD